MAEGTVKDLEEEAIDCSEELDELEAEVDNLDSTQCKNNLKFRGLKEGAEGKYLVGYLTELFSGWVGADSEMDISIITVYCIGLFRSAAKFPWDITVKFPYWNTKVHDYSVLLGATRCCNRR